MRWNELTKLQVDQRLLSKEWRWCITTEPNLRFLGKNLICQSHNWPLLPQPIQRPVRGDEETIPVAGLVAAPGAGSDLRRVFKARPLPSGSRSHGGCSQTHQDGYYRETLGGDSGAHHELGALALTPVEAVETIGKGRRCAQAAYGYHWILAGLANKLLLEAFRSAVHSGAKALNDWGVRRFKRCLRGRRARS